MLGEMVPAGQAFEVSVAGHLAATGFYELKVEIATSANEDIVLLENVGFDVVGD